MNIIEELRSEWWDQEDGCEVTEEGINHKDTEKLHIYLDEQFDFDIDGNCLCGDIKFMGYTIGDWNDYNNKYHLRMLSANSEVFEMFDTYDEMYDYIEENYRKARIKPYKEMMMA